MPERHLAAALRRLPRGREDEPAVREPLVHEPDQQVRQAPELVGDTLHGHAVEAGDAVPDGAEREDRRGADEALVDGLRRPEAVLEAELIGMREPAGDGGLVRRDGALRHVDVGRRAGAAVQELVGAADGVVHAPAVERERDRAGGVAEVPDQGHAAFAAVRGDPRHVVHGAGAKVDVGEGCERGPLVDGAGNLRRVREHEVEALAEEPDQPFQDVGDGREVAPLGDHPAPSLAAAQQRGRQLEHVDGGGVRDDHLARGCADQGRDGVARAAREEEPVGIEPALDEPLAPFRPDQALDVGGRGLRQRPEGVAVEVENAVGQGEALPAVRQRALPVQPLARRAIHHRHRRALRTGFGRRRRRPPGRSRSRPARRARR